MKIIDRILKEAGYTKRQLIDCEIKKQCNGMGAKGGIQWTDKMRKMKYFQSNKQKKLLTNMDYISDIHDIEYIKGGFILRFIKVNYDLAVRMVTLLHWASIIGRLGIFLLCFFGTSIFGARTFNWHLQSD